MEIFGIGNVTACNNRYIFLNDDGKQSRVKATEERLKAIFDRSAENFVFYERLLRECHAQYEARKAAAEKKYHYITDEDIEAVFKAEGRSQKWFDMTLMKDNNNEECARQFSRVFGWSDACSYALDNKTEADRLYKQSKGALSAIHRKGD